jgi:hypothetical protein
MAVPLRKDKSEDELTTADLAQGARPAEQRTTDTPGPRPVASERNIAERDVASETAAHADDSTPLFPSGELDSLRTRWKEIQTAFVDEPRKAVEQADGLVAQAMKRLAEVFAEERSKLEGQWDRGDNVSTEDLRVALQRYRTFFHRLLSI